GRRGRHRGAHPRHVPVPEAAGGEVPGRPGRLPHQESRRGRGGPPRGQPFHHLQLPGRGQPGRWGRPGSEGRVVKTEDRFLDEARRGEDRMARFLSDIISTPSLSRRENAVVLRIGDEMTALGYDDVVVDGLGSVMGRIGDGPVHIVFDSHIDTVDVGDPSSWRTEPFKATVERGVLYGRGASDNKAATASMVHGAALIKRLGADASRYT